METTTKIIAYFDKAHPFKESIGLLRSLVLETELEETFKWSFPVYTINNKNVLGICRFANHFGIWFFHGALLKDPKKVLENAQEGKTKNMRHWKFTSKEAINRNDILTYIHEAIENQKKGIVPKKSQATKKEPINIPDVLGALLESDPEAQQAFQILTPYKQREYCEYIETAKQEKTKQSRLEKIAPMIRSGKGLNDAYRK